MPLRKKSKKKAPKRKIKKRIRCLQVKDVDRFYQILNMVQSKNKEANIFIEDDTLLPTAENIMKDAGVIFNKHKDIDRQYYHILPPKKRPDSEIILDEIEDEDIDVLFFEDFL